MQAQQDRKQVQAFRENIRKTGLPLMIPYTLNYQLLETFILMQQASGGDVLAQHELGLRYLLGRGFPADTPKAVYWLAKAAEHDLPMANYNLGILYIQGVGVAWNPFEAFNHFHAAAEDDMPEAEYIMGIMYAENFVVPRNWPQTYKYISRAAEQGLEEAKEIKKELLKRGLDTTDTKDVVAPGKERPHNTAARSTKQDTAFNFVFLDFQHTDTSTTIADTTLIKEAYQALPAVKDSAQPEQVATTEIDSASRSAVKFAAESSNPEALCMLGRCYEKGLGVKKDLILAGEYYFRALRVESTRAPALLWQLMRTEEFEKALETRSQKNDPDALYLWAGLTAIEFNKMLSGEQAVKLLARAALAGHLPSLIELGLCYLTGRWVKQDKDKATELWTHASVEGDVEADIRIATANVVGELQTESVDSAISTLRRTSKNGSILSDLGLAYCYEKGIGVPQEKGEAYRIYQKAMRRGSEKAFEAVRRMHDELRPAESEFQLRQ
ncbi:MAG TPA: tetratricopeptide repeat protein [Bacteroidota bacterium]|nr:tetratricopeptide repeat protein [Bacteroidota bacterium]